MKSMNNFATRRFALPIFLVSVLLLVETAIAGPLDIALCDGACSTKADPITGLIVVVLVMAGLIAGDCKVRVGVLVGFILPALLLMFGKNEDLGLAVLWLLFGVFPGALAAHYFCPDSVKKLSRKKRPESPRRSSQGEPHSSDGNHRPPISVQPTPIKKPWRLNKSKKQFENTRTGQAIPLDQCNHVPGVISGYEVKGSTVAWINDHEIDVVES